jgi:cyclophilin family peptidyl-prolyl cis-trans isomerase
LLFAVAVVPVAAQDAAAPPAPAAQAAEQGEFDELLGKLKSMRGELDDALQKYRSAKLEERPQLVQLVRSLNAKGLAMQERLFEVAQRAYLQAPNANPNVTSVMLQIIARDINLDRYGDAIARAKSMMAKQCDNPVLYDMAGIAAFATSDFDAAEKYFGLAKQQQALSEMGQMHASQTPYYKDAWAKEQKIREAEAKADDLPRVLLKTSAGDIEIELFENEAPNTVANFISLVEKGFYNGLTFHRVIPAFMAQGGCPKGDGTGGPGYHIPCECYRNDYRKHFIGTLSMAHAGRNTGGSQFFITFQPTQHLDGKHTAFGRVVKGLDVLPKIQRRDPQDPNAPAPDKIIEAKVLRKRNHPYTVKMAGDEFNQ